MTTTPSRLSLVSPCLIAAALVSALFFNGLALSWFATALGLLLIWFTLNGVMIYRSGLTLGNRILPVFIILFWLWLGIGILFSPIKYLGIINFWWVGALPVAFLGYLISPDKDLLWQRLLPLLMLIGIGLSGYALYEFFILHGRANATFFTKNSLAAFLSLLLFPMLGQLLDPSSRRMSVFLAMTVFLFAFMLGLIQSRGAWIGLAAGLLIVYGFGFTRTHKNTWLAAGLFILLGFAAAALVFQLNPESGSGMVERVISLQDTERAGHSRFVIWQPAWRLFLQHPWTGIGLGTYFMAIPPFLNPQDHSANFYVHNDYLQIALETGLPGLLLMLSVFVVVLVLFIQALQRTTRGDGIRTEFLALFAALFAFALHSGFTFNFYIMPSMMLAGMLLGRFNILHDSIMQRPYRHLELSRLLRPHLYYPLLLLVSLVLGVYFFSQGAGYYYLNKGKRLVAERQLEKAHQALLRAQRLTPLVDSPWFLDADLLRRSAEVIASHPRQSHNLLIEAEQKVRAALRRNPLRPQSWYILGKIDEQRRPDDLTVRIELYGKALQRDPRFVPARIALARLYLQENNSEAAFTVLTEGFNYAYRHVTPTLLDYVALSMTTADNIGEHNLALQLSRRLTDWQPDLDNPDTTPTPVAPVP